MRDNYRFHFALYQNAQSRILKPIAETLWLRYGPISRIICGKYGTSNLVDQHEETMAMLRMRDHKGVGQAIRTDIEQGFEIVRSSFEWALIRSNPVDAI